MRIFTWKKAAAAAAACVVLYAGRTVVVRASDHADPQVLRDPDANITDLFFFPDGDRYVVILDVHRALTAMPPYELAKYEYRINFDWHTGVSFENGEQDTVRYGGKISQPEGIKEDATIKIRLNNEGTFMGKPEYLDGDGRPGGLLHADQIQPFAGLRADPFIFPRFFKKNTIAMVFSMPKDAIPEIPGRQPGVFLLWAAAFKDGKQVDHVGRSNRTQQARFEALNTLHPSEHVRQIKEDMTFWDKWYTTLSNYRETQQFGAAIQILIQVRSKNMYDFAPDVMVYSDAREHDPNVRPGFPNGRHIQDDVASITCAEGDCILQELSFVEGDWPRRKVSDKPVPTDAKFPYLLEPYAEGQFAPNRLPSPLPSLDLRGLAKLGLLTARSLPRLNELELLPVNGWIIGWIICFALVLVAIELWLIVQTIEYRRLLREQRQVI